jgi:hypothetical protein
MIEPQFVQKVISKLMVETLQRLGIKSINFDAKNQL